MVSRAVTRVRMMKQLVDATPGGHFGATRGVRVVPSSTTFADATAGVSTPNRPTAAAATAFTEDLMFPIEHDGAAEVAQQACTTAAAGRRKTHALARIARSL